MRMRTVGVGAGCDSARGLEGAVAEVCIGAAEEPRSDCSDWSIGAPAVISAMSTASAPTIMATRGTLLASRAEGDRHTRRRGADGGPYEQALPPICSRDSAP